MHLPVGFTTETTNLFLSLMPDDRPEGTICFPSDLPNKDCRTQAEDTPVAWLQRVAAQTKYPDLLRLFPNVAFVSEVSWFQDNKRRPILKEVHCQAVVTPGVDINQAVDGAEVPSQQYFRVDFEPWNLGKYVFPDPIPHAHSNVKNEPRFPLALVSTTPHVDMVEFLLRNYNRRLWQVWADRIWDERVWPTLPALYKKPGEGNVRNAIKTAFAANQHELLADKYGGLLRNWKKAMVDEKRGMSTIIIPPGIEDLSY